MGQPVTKKNRHAHSEPNIASFVPIVDASSLNFFLMSSVLLILFLFTGYHRLHDSDW